MKGKANLLAYFVGEGVIGALWIADIGLFWVRKRGSQSFVLQIHLA